MWDTIGPIRHRAGRPFVVYTGGSLSTKEEMMHEYHRMVAWRVKLSDLHSQILREVHKHDTSDKAIIVNSFSLYRSLTQRTTSDVE